MKTRIFSCVAALAVAVILTSTASANLLANPDFEDTSTPPTGHAAPDWPTFTFTSSSSVDTSMPHGGAQALVEVGGTETTGSTGVFQQIDGIVAGEEYTLSVWAKAGALPIASDDTYGGAVIRIQFEDDTMGGGSAANDTGKVELALGPVNGTTLLTTDYQEFTITGVAPAGTTQLKVNLYSRHSDQAIYFDDADLMGLQIPEPTAIVLALFGGLGCLGLRRRA